MNLRRGGFIGGATGLEMERWSAGIVAAWGVVMLPLSLRGLFWMILSRRKLADMIREHWCER